MPRPTLAFAMLALVACGGPSRPRPHPPPIPQPGEHITWQRAETAADVPHEPPPVGIHADILQVGHHGSKTSSRHAFLAAIAPSLALVSSGPKVYGQTVLPDAEVIDELERIGARVLRTDERDADCLVHGRMGGDDGPGGCDSWIITIAPRP